MRTFVAVPLDSAIRQRAVALQGQLGQAGTHREVGRTGEFARHAAVPWRSRCREVLEVCRSVQSAARPFAVRNRK